MIPKIVPPLTSLSVLVTRPAPQAARLADRLAALGAEPLVLPAIEIKPVRIDTADTRTTSCYDLVIFVSTNAVEHGAAIVARSATTRIAAIGKATAAALDAMEIKVDVVPARGFTSEDLLAQPTLSLAPGARVLIVRGAGGRDVLEQSFAAQGCEVALLDVYERALPHFDPAQRDDIESRWAEGDIPVATVTSVETLNNLCAMLSERGRAILETAVLVVPSERVRDAAVHLGLRGECIVAAGADDDSMSGALALWHTRARLTGA